MHGNKQQPILGLTNREYHNNIIAAHEDSL